MAKSGKKGNKQNKFRFLNFSNAAVELQTDAGVISRGIASGRLPGGEMQVYVKVEENGTDNFYEVGGSTIKVVDMGEIEVEKTQVVKFRKKSK